MNGQAFPYLHAPVTKLPLLGYKHLKMTMPSAILSAIHVAINRRQQIRYSVFLAFMFYLLGYSHFPLGLSSQVLPEASATLRPQGHDILSFSLYGDSDRYVDGAIANSRLYSEVYKSWRMRVYFDHSVPEHVLGELEANDVELVNMTGSTHNKMTWRFLPVSDPGVRRVCVRDIDSRLSLREKAAVDEWIRSGKAFHVMRDHPSHSLYAMSGGMWCAQSGEIQITGETLQRANVGDQYLADMDFLNSVVWPTVKDNVLQHDSFSCLSYKANPFPLPRVGMEHVGAVFINNEMREIDVSLLREALQQGKSRSCE